MTLRIIYISLLLGFFGTIWTACDKVDEPLVLIDQQSTTDDLLDTLYFIDSVIVNTKQVLLEEFTGHKCVNCAGASISAHELSEANDHKLIIYGVHAGYYAEPDLTGNYTTDFRTETGNELNTDFQVIANPIGTINRVEYSGSKLIGEGSWEAAVLAELGKENVVDLKVIEIYYPTLSTLQLKVYATFHQALTGRYKAVAYIAEDHIISPQKNNEEAVGPTPDWLDYEHRNILRDAISPTYGTRISEEDIVAEMPYIINFTYAINENWVAANCNVIVYVIHEETLEVLQVAEVGIKTEE
jgi:hypothetical protein